MALSPSVIAQPGDALNVKNNNNGVVTVKDGGSNNPTLPEVKSITVEAWVKMTNTKDFARIAIRPDGDPSDNPQNFVNESTFFLGFGSSGSKPRFAVQIDDRSDASVGVEDITLGNSINTGQWYHLAGTYDHTNGEFKIYVNGEEKDSTTHTDFSGSADPIVDADGSGISSIHLGASDIGIMSTADRGYYPFDGELDEVRIWDDVRTQEEIKDQMHQEISSPGSKSNLIHYYRFNSTNGSGNFPDNSSNGADGTPKQGASQITPSDIQPITDATEIDGSTFNKDPRGIWPPNTTASSGGLTISEKVAIPCLPVKM